MTLIDDLKKKFIDENISKRESDSIVQRAVELAYADMSRHATGHTKAIKEKIIPIIADELQNEEERIVKDYGTWHNKFCEKIKSEMIKSGFSGTIGKTQKVINMSFKYLLLLDEESKFCRIKDNLHMVLDSYTLGWYNTFAEKKCKIGWSKIENYDDYIKIENEIKSYLTREDQVYKLEFIDKDKKTINKGEKIALPNNAFEAEFIIWEGEKNKEKYRYTINVLKDLKNDKWFIGDSLNNYI